MQNVKLNECVKAWLAEVKLTKAPATAKKYEEHAQPFAESCGDVIPTAKGDLVTYLADATEGLAPATVALKISVLKSLYEWLEDEDYLWEEDGRARNPMKGIKRPKLKRPIPKLLTKDEDHAALKGEATAVERVLYNLLRFGGFRISEALALNVGDVDLERREIRVNDSKSADGIRSVPIVDELMPLLRMHLLARREQGATEGDPLVINTWKKRYGISGARSAIKRVGDRNGFHVAPHTLRRQFATTHINDGKRMEVISVALGHSDVAVTQRSYAFLTNATIAKELIS